MACYSDSFTFYLFFCFNNFLLNFEQILCYCFVIIVNVDLPAEDNEGDVATLHQVLLS
jgi:hypothetical protein